MIETSGPTAIYVRISEDREGERLGVERQERECRQLAKRLGWPVGQVYEDNDLSAFKLKKDALDLPAHKRLIADLQAGKFHRLVILHPDRLYRRTGELERLIPILEGVEIRTVKGGDIDLSNATGRATAKIIGSINQSESERMSERIRSKMAELVQAGAWKGGPRPFGWAADGVTEVPKEVNLLREAKDRVLKGETLRAICNDWSKRGVRSTRGKNIEETTLRKMLLRPRVVGQYARRDGSIIGAGQWKPIFTADEFKNLGLILKDKSRNKRARRPARVYLLTGGLLRCGVCGGPMYGRPPFKGHPIPYYGCKPTVGGTSCGKVHIRVPDADEMVMVRVVGYMNSPDFAKRQAKMRAESPGLNAALVEVASVESRQAELATAYGAGTISMAEWQEAKRQLKARADAARTTLDAAQADAAGVREMALLDASDFLDHWESIGVAGRRRVVLALVKEVRIQPHLGASRHFQPDRVEVSFRA